MSRWLSRTFPAFVALAVVVGLESPAFAQNAGDPNFVDATQLWAAFTKIMTLIEGPFGALVMSCAGIAAILSAAFGQYRAALSCMVVAVGSFILRGFVTTFFRIPENVIPTN